MVLERKRGERREESGLPPGYPLFLCTRYYPEIRNGNGQSAAICWAQTPWKNLTRPLRVWLRFFQGVSAPTSCRILPISISDFGIIPKSELIRQIAAGRGKQRFVCALPPHPGPLPRGEGEWQLSRTTKPMRKLHRMHFAEVAGTDVYSRPTPSFSMSS